MKTLHVEFSLRTAVALVFIAATMFAGLCIAAVAGSGSRWSGNLLVFDGTSGNNAFAFDVNGLRGDFGSGSNDTIESNGTYLLVGSTAAGYVASGTPFTLTSVPSGGAVVAATLQGGVLPAHAFTVTDVAYRISVQGVGGSTVQRFLISDGTNSCVCDLACNASTGNKIVTCNTSGLPCTFSASASLTYSWNSAGDCGTPSTVLGNVDVRGFWQ